ncbi:5-dehydro-4-deoxy-D-glucuronate isomerase [Weissella coleopterorum]|uniref:4-deoxy-L-threo-5-hexosulose-uronate ketol-isomerase n=1 Tax=Weissella coleopterorum TaxID=2714949 RepID=A0A6G8B1S7_9LACO|nr:5-dehydro-4-deoxy-D-glucuronate isomerase [Weissella coleopterorum]QIL51190.1 5-dehydro-4-deoxy-D-glucuronate isomerase [Weissella coleopterorum]
MTFKMETKYAHAPKDIEHYSTAEMREEFLMEKIFNPGDVLLTYTMNDRLIFGGVTPTIEPLEIILNSELGVNFFLERRELGFINIGGAGYVTVDGKKDLMNKQDGYYVSMGTQHVIFESVDVNNPAKFYVASAPAHKVYPSKKIAIEDITPLTPGDQEHMNKRKIYQYIHPNQVEANQLQMGYTVLANGSSWNTMPAHTHMRRMETYMYFDFADKDTRAMHIMGTPDETKHIFLESEQAVTNPSWSIHSGVATGSYTFIWAMCGENITYDDMDHVDMHNLK